MLACACNVVRLSNFDSLEIRRVVLSRTEGDYRRALSLFDKSVSGSWLNCGTSHRIQDPLWVLGRRGQPMLTYWVPNGLQVVQTQGAIASILFMQYCDKGLVFEKRVHSFADTDTGEKREGRSTGAAVPAFIPLGLRQSDRSD